MSLSASQFPSDIIERAGAKMFGNLDCATSSAGFLFNKVELGTLACIIAASGLVLLGRASECGIPVIIPSYSAAFSTEF